MYDEDVAEKWLYCNWNMGRSNKIKLITREEQSEYLLRIFNAP
jgi:hypothetical protein